MFTATLTITVETNQNDCLFWTVRMVSKTGDDIKTIVEQNFAKADYNKADAANLFLDNQTSYFDVIFGDS